ncbi:uncharacterized protein LOC126780461 [Nymphalis io]|uniref:uncharacterized protein LOC126780461 n=1 Tax=Inachis io TaxID=171585 RepID=UPI0021677E3C|nr:uncharacterized protein LOC126780461 [Nymphalis io]
MSRFLDLNSVNRRCNCARKMADLKPLLKRAKKSIDKRNYVEAEIWCKRILEIDTQNYLALAYFGKILGETDEALEYFQRAIGQHPKKSFAWQCLAKYYERKDNSNSKFELLRVYDEILKLKIDRDKAEEIICKVAEIGFSLKDLNSATILINYLSTKPAHYLYQFTEFKFLEMLNVTVAPDSERLSMIIRKITQKIIRDPTNDSMCILLGKIILMYRKFARAFHYLMELPYFPSNVVFRMWFCKYLCIIFAQFETFWGVVMENYYDDIVQGYRNSKYANLLNSMILYNKKKYLDAYCICNQLVDYEEVEIAESLFLIKCTFKTRNWAISEVVIKKFLSRVIDFNYTLELNKFLFLALAQQKKWPQALAAARNIPLDMLLVQEQATLATCYIENKENPEHIMNILQPTAYYVQLKALALIVNEHYTEAINMLQREAENSVNYFYMGRSYWQLKQYEVSYTYFLKAVKLDANYAEAYFYMGMFYEFFKLQFFIAKLNYEKAHQLDRTNPNILKRLSDVYLNLDLKEKNYHLLRNVNHLVITLPWLHFRLAVYFKEKKDWKATIRQLKYVVKYDNTNIQALEYLADAYEADKRIDLAIECLYKIIDLVHTKEVKCLYRIANILNSAERYQEALNLFEKMLHLSPRSLFALKGTTDVNMKLAEINAKRGHFQLARHAAQNSIMYLITSIGICNKTFINWNILANAILFIATLPDNHCYLEIRFDLNQELGNLGSINTKMNMYKLGYYCFWRGQSLLPSHIERHMCRLLASEIFDDELRATLARYSSTYMALEYRQGVGYIARHRNNRPLMWRR